MATEQILDIDRTPLEVGAMYCCVNLMLAADGREICRDYGALVRYVGVTSGEYKRHVFADADTWEETRVYADQLLKQQAPAIDPATQGWADL
ncbi:hypothetical protein [Pseudomonas aeruginosa]|uniref:hypothetical protein n=1 Tax=Pseudomonas aeruginosa TaxID=287 RepID=UPI00071C1CF2|nr:hypothetical protein [Pseudomonas aeruginosa]KSN66553.1 hypothetical protein APA89_04630 [Pseudomonas aeruginosa]MBG4429817.1 hypothetical protein [Pseudomonas aeruginosa]MBG4472899.1 hypothetical protein [Pseudomonas aeruginosa]MBV6064522.1 hypothetical protein [Pseudomonas aeruginosa]MBV6165322.1 hypothetical protein [Pseudomonas aeruginosa]